MLSIIWLHTGAGPEVVAVSYWNYATQPVLATAFSAPAWSQAKAHHDQLSPPNIIGKFDAQNLLYNKYQAW